MNVKKRKIWYGGQLLGDITLSVGLVEAPQEDVSAYGLLRAADEALYAAKRCGRDHIVAHCDLEKIRENEPPKSSDDPTKRREGNPMKS